MSLWSTLDCLTVESRSGAESDLQLLFDPWTSLLESWGKGGGGVVAAESSSHAVASSSLLPQAPHRSYNYSQPRPSSQQIPGLHLLQPGRGRHCPVVSNWKPSKISISLVDDAARFVDQL